MTAKYLISLAACLMCLAQAVPPALAHGNSEDAPGREVIHQAGKGREIIPLKLDLAYLRETRANGWQNLGQTLKSFRDSAVAYPPYMQGAISPALDALGELAMPGRPNRDEEA